ncbi:MAG: hypothetical protein MJZ19_06920 [Paludibacteraceae bacterium]|nr:hypothetical protein [Paludibacteraceae bacterium]
MKIRISEKKLHTILSEKIRAVLEENKRGMLNEMALPRKDYKDKVDSLIPQILENWCLVRYCSITDRTEYKIHWSDELRGHLLTVSRFSIKGNDSIESRKKVLQEIWTENDYNQAQFLNMTVVNKFIKEGIDTSTAEYGQVLKDCIDAEQDLFDIILSRDVDLITNYSRNI